jgi:hypothetical protein
LKYHFLTRWKRMDWCGKRSLTVSTVKTGYRLLMREKREKENQGVIVDWSSVWKIRVPPRVKHLLWWICRDCLPTITWLRQHYVPCLTICQIVKAQILVQIFYLCRIFNGYL